MVKGMIDAYFKENSLVKQQIESYNRFIEEGMQKVVDSVGKLRTNVEGFEIQLGKIRIEPPRYYELKGGYRRIYPSESRIRNLTYASPIFLEMIPVHNGVERPVYSAIFVGELPMMVRSKSCYLSQMTQEELTEVGEDPIDPGGYFVVNGSERVLIGLEDLVPNKVLTTKEKDNSTVSKVFSTAEGLRVKCTVTRTKEGIYALDFPSAPSVNLLTMLRLFGLKENSDLEKKFDTSNLVIKNDLLYNMEVEEERVKDTAENYIANKFAPGQPKEYRFARVWYLVDNYLLPHLGKEEKDRNKKALYLIKMAERATLVFHNRLQQDDKDHYGNKRVKLAGELMEELFRYALNYLIKDIIYQASRADIRGRKLQVQTLVRQDALSDRILYAMATGNWIAGQTGISQLLDRTSFLSTLSHRRRIVSPLSKRHPHFEARDLHGTHYGKICPSETPEGPSASLVKNLALFSEVTTGIDKKPIEDLLKSFKVEEDWVICQKKKV